MKAGIVLGGSEVGVLREKAVRADKAGRGLLFDVHAIFVAELEKRARGRIVRRADEIDVGLAGEEDVAAVELPGRAAAEEGRDVVAAGPPELDRAAVDEETVAAELEPAEADAPARLLDRFAANVETGDEGVEVRVLSVPGKADLGAAEHLAGEARRGEVHRRGGEADALAGRVVERKLQAGSGRSVKRRFRGDSERGGAGVRIPVGIDIEARNVIRRQGDEPYVAKDAADEVMSVAAGVGDVVCPVGDLDREPGGWSRG